MPLTLVALAAGRSTRFGSLKQVAPVTPGGASLLACTTLDALRGGFERVAVVVRAEIQDEVEAHLRRHLGPEAPLRWIVQPQPLGTAHALLVAAEALADPPALALANGDDLYGREAMTLLARATRRLSRETGEDRSPDPSPQAAAGALVGYRMADTLSPEGGVSRGWVRTQGEGDDRVTSVQEYLEVTRASEGMVGRPVTPAGTAGAPSPLPPDAVASMNLWAVDRGAVHLLRERFRRWGAGSEGDAAEPSSAGSPSPPDAGARAREFSLAPELDAAVQDGRLSLRLEGVAEGWMGLTFAGDLAEVRARLAAAPARERYPAPLARGLADADDAGVPAPPPPPPPR